MNTQHQEKVLSNAFRRTQIVGRHLMADASSSSSSSSSSALSLCPTSFEDLQSEFVFREYNSKSDDAAFIKLESECCQEGVTKLQSQFVLKYCWEQIQPKGWSCIAEDNKGDMVGVVRSYIYDCYVNGNPTLVSYAFLFRVHPSYRRKNLAVWLTTQLFFYNVQEADVDYLSSWVMAGNVSSLTFQKRMTVEAETKHGMPPPCDLTEFSCTGNSTVDLDKSQLMQFINACPCAGNISKISGQKEIDFICDKFRDSQFRPLDLDKLYDSELSLGTYVIRREDDDEILASVSLWNSSEIRISFHPGSDFRTNGAILAYNPYHHPSEEGRLAFNKLAAQLCLNCHKQGVPFLYFFFPQISTFDAFDEFLKKSSKIHVRWVARIWFLTNSTPIHTDKDTVVFYDPRQCLI